MSARQARVEGGNWEQQASDSASGTEFFGPEGEDEGGTNAYPWDLFGGSCWMGVRTFGFADTWLILPVTYACLKD